MIQGCIKEAAAAAEQADIYADRGGYEPREIHPDLAASARTAAGEFGRAVSLFAEAEEMQSKFVPITQLIVSKATDTAT